MIDLQDSMKLIFIYLNQPISKRQILWITFYDINNDFGNQLKGLIMSKITEEIYNLDNVDEAIRLINEDKYVTLDTVAAFYAILATTLSKARLRKFVLDAERVIPNMEFIPLRFKEIKDYIEGEFASIQSKENGSLNINEMSNLVGMCSIYAQKYDYSLVNSKSKIFILRTPKIIYFDIAREAIAEVIRLFKKGLDHGVLDDSDNIEGVEVMVRGREKFIDLIISNYSILKSTPASKGHVKITAIPFPINSEAWVGFDFR